MADECSYKYPDVVHDDILRMVPDDGKVIGSIGCGYAPTEAKLVADGRVVHGVDISEEAIAVAATRLTSARVINPTEFEPFEPDSLDGLILADVIEHIPNAWDVLASYARAVKPGGWVVISVPNMRNWYTLWQIIVRGDWPEDKWGIFDSTHLQFMTQKRLDRWGRQAGLKLDERFDRYNQVVRRRWRRLERVVDLGTFRLLRSWLMFQLQCRYRVRDDR